MIELMILKNLLHTEAYWRKTLPYLKEDYFQDRSLKLVFRLIHDYSQKYGKPPTIDALSLEADQGAGPDQTLAEKSASVVLDLAERGEETNVDWLVDQTEEFCRDQAIQNGIRASIKILEGEDKDHDKGYIVQLMQDALAVSFDTRLGHDYFEDAESRWEHRNTPESRVPFDLDYLNKLTNGGLKKKSLTVFMGGTGVGKSLVMGHLAAAHVAMGLNVLYISAEMAEEDLGDRVDANVTDVSINELKNLPKKAFLSKIDKVREKTKGKLIIHEYPTSSASVAHVRYLLNELKIKKNFVPDVIYIDYLNIFISSRMKMGGSVNSYTYIKAIAEEFRGLSMELGIPVITATQVNREGFTNSDPGLENTSESFGLPATADLFIAITTNDELEALGQYLFKQLKNRMGNPNKYKRFLVGVDKERMRLYDLSEATQETIQGRGSDVQRPSKGQAEMSSRDLTKFDNWD